MGRSVTEWTVEINKNMLTSVKRCLLFSRLWRLCQAIKSTQKQKKHIAPFSFSVQRPENVESRKFHTVRWLRATSALDTETSASRTPAVPFLWVCLRGVALAGGTLTHRWCLAKSWTKQTAQKMSRSYRKGLSGKIKCYPIIRGVWANILQNFLACRLCKKFACSCSSQRNGV